MQSPIRFFCDTNQRNMILIVTLISHSIDKFLNNCIMHNVLLSLIIFFVHLVFDSIPFFFSVGGWYFAQHENCTIDGFLWRRPNWLSCFSFFFFVKNRFQYFGTVFWIVNDRLCACIVMMVDTKRITLIWVNVLLYQPIQQRKKWLRKL